MVEKQRLVAIIGELQNGNQDAAATLYEAYYRDLHYYILKRVNDPEKAEALTQDTFIEIFDTIGTLGEADIFVEWSRQIANQRCDAYKKMRRELLLGKVGATAVDSVEEERKDLHANESGTGKAESPVREVIDSLSEDQRKAVLASYVGEKNEEDDKMTVPATGIRAVGKAIEPLLRKLIVGIVATVILAMIREVGVDLRHKAVNGTSQATVEGTETIEGSGSGEDVEQPEESGSVETTESPEGTEHFDADIEVTTEDGNVGEVGDGSGNEPETETKDGAVTGEENGTEKETEEKTEEEPTEISTEVEKTTERETEPKTEGPTTETIEKETVDVDNTVLASTGLDYLRVDDYYIVTGIGSCVDRDVVIPAEYNGLPVCEIDENAFTTFSELRSIVIPGSVTVIGKSAFEECDELSEITLSEGLVSIGERAFSGCGKLISITIPRSVTQIGDEAFSACNELRYIFVEEGNSTYHSAGRCLIETESKTLIAGCKNSVIPADGSVTSIADLAFWCCYDLKEIVIPESVTKIGWAAFSGCESLSKVTFTGYVESMGNDVFSNCRDLQSITLPNGDLSNYENTFVHCSNLTSITIPAGVTGITPNLFLDCTALKDIIVKEGNSVYHSEGNCLIETVTKTLILGCKNSVIPGDGSVEKIGNKAFATCRNLTKIEIPNGVTEIGDEAFYMCENLVDISIAESVSSIGKNAFCGCNSLPEIEIPDGVVSIGEGAFSFCNQLKKIALPATLTSFGEKLTYESNEIEAITVKEGNPVYHSAGNCLIDTANKKVVFGCKNSVIPADGSVTTIGEYAFYSRSSLTEIIVPNTITSIGAHAFLDCVGLTSITIPASVTQIGIWAFNRCSSLESIVVEEGNPVYHSAGNCLIETGSKTLIIGCKNSVIPADGSVTIIGREAFSNCRTWTNVVIPEGITVIGGYAFAYSELKSVTIPASTKEIISSFYDCKKLDHIYYAGTIRAWNLIQKHDRWDEGSGSYIVHCSDGEIYR